LQHLLQITKLVIRWQTGTLNVPIVDASQYNKLGMDNLFIHEVSGVIFNSLQRENQTYPKLENLPAIPFSEGWALYAESLGEELGLYTDPYQN
jgi:uncharacterized protein (DUF885 family)